MEILLMQFLIWGLMYGYAIESACLESTPPNHEQEIWKKSFMENYPLQHSNRGCIGPSCQTEMILKFNVDVQKQTAEVSSVEY